MLKRVELGLVLGDRSPQTIEHNKTIQCSFEKDLAISQEEFFERGVYCEAAFRCMDDKEIIEACHRYIPVNYQVMSYGSPPTGLRLFKRAAFPRINDKDSCWKRRWTVVLSSSLILGTRRKAFSVPILTELVEYETSTCFHHHCALLAQIMGSETLEVRTRNGDWRRQLVMQPAVYTAAYLQCI